MTPTPFRRALRTTLALAAIPALAPAAASASTWTVDDDRAQCPSAGFRSIQAAVDQAAPWDTIVVCPGLYREQSTPSTSANSPAQAGSRNGLTITKPLTIRGAGADRVTIRPSPALGGSLAGTAPYLRDGGGNVVTVSRQSLGSSDDNENFVDISGVTIDSPDAYVEAGVGFFNSSGRISRSVVGPLRRAAPDTELAGRPHGWGIVMSNSLQGDVVGGIRREVSVVDSLVTGYQAGGILFDDARGPDGSASLLTRSGIRAYGNVVRTRVAGGGSGSAVAQTGVQFHAGQRGSVVDSEILDNSSGAARSSVGVLLTDAETGDDIANPGVRALKLTGNRYAGNGYAVYNATIDNGAIRPGAPVLADDSYWGCPSGPLTTASSPTTLCQGRSGNAGTPAAASVDVGTPRTAPPAALAVPSATPDAPPTGSFLDPVDGLEVPVGQAIEPVVAATDDFGVRSVALTANGVPVATVGTRPYLFSWAPTPDQAGSSVRLRATIEDSAGQTTELTTSVVVPALPGSPTPPIVPPAPVPAAVVPISSVGPTLSGSATVGSRVSCSTGSWTGGPTGYGFAWLRDGTPIGGAIGNSYALRPTDVGARIGCRVTARNADGAAVPAPSASRLVGFRTTKSPFTTRVQVGRSIVTLPRTVAVRPTAGGATLAKLLCGQAAPCAVRLAGTVEIGRSSSRVALTRRIAAGASSSLTVRLSSAARRALGATRSGRVALTTTVTGPDGASHRYRNAVRIVRR